MAKNRIRLGVNIDHIATIKTNRKTPYPSLLNAVDIAEKILKSELKDDNKQKEMVNSALEEASID